MFEQFGTGDILKWVILVFFAGFVGFFGKYLGKVVLESVRARRHRRDLRQATRQAMNNEIAREKASLQSSEPVVHNAPPLDESQEKSESAQVPEAQAAEDKKRKKQEKDSIKLEKKTLKNQQKRLKKKDSTSLKE